MKIKSFIFLVFVIAIFGCTLDKPEEPSIVGTWQWAESANDGDIYRFLANRSYTIHSTNGATENLIEEGTYSFADNILTYIISKFDDSGTYRSVTTDDFSKAVMDSCYLSSNIFSQRAMTGTSSSFVGTWNSFGAIKYYKMGAAGSYIYWDFSESTRIFTDTTYTRKYTIYHEYDINGNLVTNIRDDFVYTDVNYLDSENWSGVDSESDDWYIQSKIIETFSANYLLFEFMNRID